MILEKKLEARGVPPLPSFTPEEWPALRKQICELLCREEYGLPIPQPTELTFHEGGMLDLDEFASGYGIRYSVDVHTVVCGRPFDFSFVVCLPTRGKAPYPFFVHNDFHPGEPSRYTPIDEIVEQGFAVLHLHYNDVTTDNNDFTNGLAGCVFPDGIRHEPTDPGKIMMWAWANMRAMDYAMRCPALDCDNAAIIGHSRLGKTALVTGMLDERFRYVIANDSGCSGDAITRKKSGEHLYHILHADRWFCGNYKKYEHAQSDLPFDQHFLLATIAPRYLMTGAAVEDTWADPLSQYLGAVAASPAWESLGRVGFVHPDRFPEVGDVFDDGSVSYHLRWGKHYLGRHDWNRYIATIKNVMAKEGSRRDS